MLESLFLFALSFILLWIGSGLAVSAIQKIAHILKASSFFVSFFVLGLFTSITEIMVGVNAFLEKTPEIFVGNLIGSSVVVFILIIPILAVMGNGVKLNHTFSYRNLVSATVVVGFPALLTLDNRIGVIDAMSCIIIYGYFLYTLEQRSGLLERIMHVSITQKNLIINFIKIVFAVVLVFSASRILVDQTPVVGSYFNVSPFIISVIVISLGTNIPELSIAVRSVIARKNDIAFGNYVGSATLNSLEMGILTLLGRRSIPANGSNYSVISFILALAVFVYFVKSKNNISRNEGIALLFCYLLFILFELTTGPGWKLL